MAAKALSIEEMYRVLRGLPGRISLVAPDGESYILTVVNPNAPTNRCQETPGLAVTLEGPVGSTIPSGRVEHVFTLEELNELRSGASLLLDMDGVHVSIQSNPGGQMVLLDDDEDELALAD